MRTSESVLTLALFGIAFGLTPAVSFDGSRTTDSAPVSTPLPATTPNTVSRATPLAAEPGAPMGVPSRSGSSPFESFRSGTQALREGNVDKGVAELERAARLGVAGAIWKLGRMYADGDGVGKDEARAFEYFRQLTNHP